VVKGVFMKYALFGISMLACLIGFGSFQSFGQVPRSLGNPLLKVTNLVSEKWEYQEIYYTNGLETSELIRAVDTGWEILSVYSTGKDGSYRKVILKRERKKVAASDAEQLPIP